MLTKDMENKSKQKPHSRASKATMTSGASKDKKHNASTTPHCFNLDFGYLVLDIFSLFLLGKQKLKENNNGESINTVNMFWWLAVKL